MARAFATFIGGAVTGALLVIVTVLSLVPAPARTPAPAPPPSRATACLTLFDALSRSPADRPSIGIQIRKEIEQLGCTAALQSTT